MTNTTTGKQVGNAMVLTDRDKRLVAEICSYHVLTRLQLQALGHFGSKTRANAILARLTRFGYLSKRYQPAVAGAQRALYYPGPSAHLLVDDLAEPLAAQRRRTQTLSDLFLAHQLLVSDVRIRFAQEPGCRVDRWLTDADFRSLSLGMIPDGHIEYTHSGRRFAAFLELDRGTETLPRWRVKVQSYLRLASSDRYRSVFGRPFFRVLVDTPSPIRLQHLRRVTAGLTNRVFWFVEHPTLMHDGPFAEIWLRPVETQRHALTEP